MNFYESYIYLIVTTKLLFLLCVFTHLYYKVNGEMDSDKDKKIIILKNQLNFISDILISFLFIYIFNPYTNNIGLINKRTTFLFFIFGIISLIQAEWTTFINNSFIKYFYEN